MRKIFLIVPLFGVVLSCNTVSSIGSKIGKPQMNLENTEWELQAGKLNQSKVPTLRIEKDRISGNAGCNNYFTQAVIEPQTGRFSAKNIGSTRMACKDMQVEQNFLKMLEQSNKYLSDGYTLELYKDQLLLMKFIKKN